MFHRTGRKSFLQKVLAILVGSALLGLVIAHDALSDKGDGSRTAAVKKAAAAQGRSQSVSSGSTAERAAGKSTLPLRQVVMFTSGVAYFERRAEVEGTEEVTMRFSADAISDLLKSMIVTDEDGGQISAVKYESRAPASHVLKSFALNLADNPSLPELLEQIRGIKVEVEAPETVAGTVVSVASEQQKGEDDDHPSRTIHLLTLKTPQGLRTFQLGHIRALRIAEAEVDRELEQALDVLGNSLQTEEKLVSLRFEGEGRRNVRVGYMHEMPVWKMTYRLLLADNGEHLMQGWAVVENTSEQDWNDVHLSLVSGQPISFEMPLYEPLYVDRPTVQLDLYAGLRPQKYEQELAAMEARGKGVQEKRAALAERQRRAAVPQAAKADRKVSADALRQTAQGRATAAEVGELFRYEIETPVAIGRRQSAMIPVFNATVAGEKLSIYEQEVHAKHPLDGLKLENSTELFLMEGPITVLDDGTYAGDSLIDGIPPGDDRLLSYALDVEVEISPESDPQPEQITEMRVVNGTLYVKTKQRRQQHYRIKNTDTEARSVLIEHPRQSGWNLVEPQEPFATTRDSYRLKAAVPGGETKTVTLVFERSGQERIVLTNVQTNTLLQYKSTKGINPQVREALAEVMRRKQEIAQLQSEKKQAEEQLDEIANQQERIRKNMAELDKTTDLYQRYLKKLTEDEDQIEKLRNKIDTLAEEIQKKQNALNEYLQNLSVSPG